VTSFLRAPYSFRSLANSTHPRLFPCVVSLSLSWYAFPLLCPLTVDVTFHIFPFFSIFSVEFASGWTFFLIANACGLVRASRQILWFFWCRYVFPSGALTHTHFPINPDQDPRRRFFFPPSVDTGRLEHPFGAATPFKNDLTVSPPPFLKRRKPLPCADLVS